MPYGTSPVARRLEHGKFNRFLSALPPHDFSLLAPHLRTIPLERGVMLHDIGEEIEHVYFPHTGMVSLVAVMQSGATVETATIGRGCVALGHPISCGCERMPGHPRPRRALQRSLAGTSPTVGRVQCAPCPGSQ